MIDPTAALYPLLGNALTPAEADALLQALDAIGTYVVPDLETYAAAVEKLRKAAG